MLFARDRLKGTGVALVTPFTANGEVDYPALGNVIDYTVQHGVEYVVSLGTTGETPTLSTEEKRDILAFTIERVSGKVPIVAGVGGNHTKEVIEELHQLPIDKVDAILSASPYYNKPSQEGIYQHYAAIAQASPKPIMLYNIPGRTGRNMTAATTLRLAELPNIIGIKEASGDMVQAMEIIKHRPQDFLVVSGEDNLVLPLIAAGMDGVISVTANCYPKEFSHMVRLCLNGDFYNARQFHYRLWQCFDLLFAENNPAGVKAFLSEMNLIQNHLRLPVTPVSDALMKDIQAFVSKF